MKIVVSFATDRFYASQDKLELEAYKHGADKVIKYRPRDIDKNFIKENYKILQSPKGAGYWLWKPYFISKTIVESNFGDKILYCDAGMFPINNLNYLFKITSQNKNIVLFQVHGKKNEEWTKKECFKLMNCEGPRYFNAEQVCGAPQLYTKTNESVLFVKKLLHFCKQSEILMDNLNFKDQCDRFITHRHDQSILTNLAIKNNIEIFRDPSQFGNNFLRSNSNYPQIFNLHRGSI